jgi:parallel beta-helix repeat protein
MSNKGIIVQEQSRRNTITNSTLFNNSVGIWFYSDSTLNTIKDCIIHGNSDLGVSIETTCHNNLIFNNYFNNTRNAKDGAVNQWNITKTPGINIIGGPFLGGNYWHDYTGSDTDGDGLGDTFLSYNCSGNISNGGDYHPLLEHPPNNPPNAPSNPNPPDGATGVSTTSDLSWTGGDPILVIRSRMMCTLE